MPKDSPQQEPKAFEPENRSSNESGTASTSKSAITPQNPSTDISTEEHSQIFDFTLLILNIDDIKLFFEKNAKTLFTVRFEEAISEFDKLKNAITGDEAQTIKQVKNVMNRIGTSRSFWFDFNSGSVTNFHVQKAAIYLQKQPIHTLMVESIVNTEKRIVTRIIIGILFQYYVMGSYKIDMKKFRSRPTPTTKSNPTPSTKKQKTEIITTQDPPTSDSRNMILEPELKLYPSQAVVNETIAVKAIISNISHQENLPREFDFDGLKTVKVSLKSYKLVEGCRNTYSITIIAAKCSVKGEITVTTNDGEQLSCSFKYIDREQPLLFKQYPVYEFLFPEDDAKN